MEKKSKAAIAKMVDAKAKGKQPRTKVATDKASPEGSEVDRRISKYMKFTG